MNEIKSGRLRWAGHVERRMEGSLLKKIYTGKPGGMGGWRMSCDIGKAMEGLENEL